jgi:hypothetical protein
MMDAGSHFIWWGSNKVKVKVTRVQALRLCTGRTAHTGSRGIALLFHDHGTRRGWGVSVTPRPLFSPGKDPVPIVQEAGWVPGPVWTGAENLAPIGIRSPHRQARSQSIYRLRYPVHWGSNNLDKIHIWPSLNFSKLVCVFVMYRCESLSYILGEWPGSRVCENRRNWSNNWLDKSALWGASQLLPLTRHY